MKRASSMLRATYLRKRDEFQGRRRYSSLAKELEERWSKNHPIAKRRHRILIALTLGGHLTAREFDFLLAIKLKDMGHEVEFLLCNGVLSACQLAEPAVIPSAQELAKHGMASVCKYCYSNARDFIKGLGFDVLTLGESLTEETIRYANKISSQIDLEEIKDLRIEDIPVGEHAYAGTIRYFTTPNFSGREHSDEILRSYLYSAVITAVTLRQLLETRNFTRAVVHHGIYVPQGVIVDVAKNLGIDTCTWNISYRKNTVLFSHGDTYHRTMINEQDTWWKDYRFQERHKRIIKEYLIDRQTGKQDWIHFTGKPLLDPIKINKAIDNRDCYTSKVLILTNVMWDANIHFENKFFKSQWEWLEEIVNLAKTHEATQFIIRIHPAESRGSIPTSDPLAKALEVRLGILPSNIRVITPESTISTYGLFKLCNFAIIYGTKTGLELVASGIPTIVCGDAWIRGKGLTKDVSTKEELKQAFEEHLENPNSFVPNPDMALRYAFHFFFRRMIDINIFRRSRAGWPLMRLRKDVTVQDIVNDEGVSLIAERILDGKPFISDRLIENAI